MRVLISNGDLEVLTPMMVADIGTPTGRFASVDEAIDFFVIKTGSQRDEVVVNPVGDPGDV